MPVAIEFLVFLYTAVFDITWYLQVFGILPTVFREIVKNFILASVATVPD